MQCPINFGRALAGCGMALRKTERRGLLCQQGAHQMLYRTPPNKKGTQEEEIPLPLSCHPTHPHPLPSIAHPKKAAKEQKKGGCRSLTSRAAMEPSVARRRRGRHACSNRGGPSQEEGFGKEVCACCGMLLQGHAAARSSLPRFPCPSASVHLPLPRACDPCPCP